MEKFFSNTKQAYIWADLYGYTVTEFYDLEDDLGVIAVLLREEVAA